jgi:hypothetical protein
MFKFTARIAVLVIFLASSNIVNAQVVINEISPSSDPEWIKLMNKGNSPVDLTGWLLKDSNDKANDDIDLTGVINAGEFLEFSHKEGWLNNSGDVLTLLNNSDPKESVDQKEFDSVAEDKTVRRLPDGSDNWVIYPTPTPTPPPTPSPSPTPTASPTPSATPTKSPTPTPTPKPTPTPSKKPTPSPTPTPTEVATPDPLVLGETTSTPEPKETEKPSTSDNNPPILSIIMIAGGIGFMGASGVSLWRLYRAKSV